MGFLRICLLTLISSVSVSSQDLALDSTTFEVASVRPHPTQPGVFTFRIPSSSGLSIPQAIGNRFTEKNATLQDLIMDAYDVKAFQIIGLKDWAESPKGQHYDIFAKSAGEATPTTDQLRLMLQNLLADRFNLKLRREKKEVPVYVLSISKKGLKLRKLGEDEQVGTANPSASAVARGSFSMLVKLISQCVDRPVLNGTDLTGAYEGKQLDWMRFARDLKGGQDSGGESIFSTLEHEFGLKLDPKRELVDILVIEESNRPSEN